MTEEPDLYKKYQYSKTALLQIESVFFNPQMIPKLHLPGMQKVALFMPVLLLVVMPVVTTLLKQVKSLKRKLTLGI